MVPNHARYQTALHPEKLIYFILLFLFLQAFFFIFRKYYTESVFLGFSLVLEIILTIDF